MLPPDPKYIFRGNMRSVHCILFQITSTAEHLFAGTTNGNIHVWDLNTNRELSQIASEQNTCLSLQCLRNCLLVQYKSGLIKIYKKAESQWITDKSINIDFHHYCRSQKLSEGELCIPLKESAIGILSTNTFDIEVKLEAPNSEKLGEVMVIKPLKNEKLVLVGYEGESLYLWDIRQKKILSSLTVEKCPMALDFDTSLMKGVIAGSSDILQIFNLSINHVLQNKSKVTLKNPGTSVITMRPDSKIVAVGGWDGRVRLFSLKSFKPLAVLDQHKDTVHDIIFSTEKIRIYDDKCIMATAGKDGYVALWDIYN